MYPLVVCYRPLSAYARSESLLVTETNRSRHLGRPSSITLILSAPNQTGKVVGLLQKFSPNYKGAIIVAQEHSAEASAQLANRVTGLVKLEVRRVTGSRSLDRGKIFLVQPDLNYQISTADQITPIAGYVHGGSKLLESLAQRFPNRTRVVVLSTIYSAQLKQVSAAASKQLTLLSLENIRAMVPALFSGLANRYSVQLCSDTAELYGQITAPTKKHNPRTASSTSNTRGAYDQILQLLQDRKKFDFSQYREAGLLNRIENRMHRLRISNLEQYAERLRIDKPELDSLHANLFIGMTQFFRDTSAFLELQQLLIDYIERNAGRPLNIWSAGCSTGAEPYSVALICDLIRRTQVCELEAKIYATDIDPKAIAVAQEGCFSLEEIELIPAEYLPPEIARKENQYDLRSSVATEIVFEQQDLISAPAKSDLDLIICRNVFIYFNPETQERVLESFHQNLKAGGLLMLGRNESTGTVQTHFQTLSERAKIYKALQLSPSS